MLAQVPGTDTLIDTAASHGWEAAAIAVVLITLLTGLGVLMRALWSVNARLANRVTNLETTIEGKLFGLVERSITAFTAHADVMDHSINVISSLEVTVNKSLEAQQKIITRLENSPCLATVLFSKETQQIIADGIKNKVINEIQS